MLSLTSCGFRLFDKDILPDKMHIIHLESSNPNGRLEVALKNELKENHIVLSTQEESLVTLNIINTAFIHSNPSNVAYSSLSTVYSLAYSLTFDLLDKAGNKIINPEVVTVSRSITLNPNELLDSSPRVLSVKAEMQRELIFKMFNILQKF